MYPDKSLVGLGGFYYKYPSAFCTKQPIEQKTAFVAKKKICKDSGCLLHGGSGVTVSLEYAISNSQNMSHGESVEAQ